MELSLREVRNQMEAELFRLRTKNPRYSLRAYARRLGLSPATVCSFLKGHRQLGIHSLEKIGPHFALASADIEELRYSTRRRAKQFAQLSGSTVADISNWYFFAVLSLAEIPGFQEDPHWIGRRLNIRSDEAASALTLLKAHGLLASSAQEGNGSSFPQFATTDGISNSAIRKSHRQGLALAERSLDSDPVEARDFSAMTLAIDVKKLPNAVRKIRKFRRELGSYLESGSQTEVYRLSVQLFPLSRKLEDTQ